MSDFKTPKKTRDCCNRSFNLLLICTVHKLRKFDWPLRLPICEWFKHFKAVLFVKPSDSKHGQLILTCHLNFKLRKEEIIAFFFCHYVEKTENCSIYLFFRLRYDCIFIVVNIFEILQCQLLP